MTAGIDQAETVGFSGCVRQSRDGLYVRGARAVYVEKRKTRACPTRSGGQAGAFYGLQIYVRQRTLSNEQPEIAAKAAHHQRHKFARQIVRQEQ